MTDDLTAETFRLASVQDDCPIGKRPIDLAQTDRLLEAARRGLAAPDRLSAAEIQSICRSLILQFAQMGIG